MSGSKPPDPDRQSIASSAPRSGSAWPPIRMTPTRQPCCWRCVRKIVIEHQMRRERGFGNGLSG